MDYDGIFTTSRVFVDVRYFLHHSRKRCLKQGVRVMMLDVLLLIAAGALIALWLDFKANRGDDEA